MIGNIQKLFLLFILFGFSSCEAMRQRFAADQESQPQIRIVDLSGKPKPIKTFIPEGNVQALSQQGRFSSSAQQNNYAANQNAMTPEVPYVAQNDLSTIPAPTPVPAIEPSQNVSKDPEVVVSYDMSDDKKNEEEVQDVVKKQQSSSAKKFKFASQETQAPQKTKFVKDKVKKSSGTLIFVQIGSFSARDSAQTVLNKNSDISSGKIQEVNIAGRTNYRVLLGPSSDKQSAKQILTQARNAGYNDAFIAK